MTASSPFSAAPGWYSDPHGQHALRWFDGVAWTHHVAAAPAYPQPPVYGSPSGYPQAPLGASPSDPVHWLVPTGRTWQAIVAGYLGLVALFIWPLGPVAVGFGVWALKVSGGRGAHGRGRAVFAIVAGALGTLFLVLVL